MRKHEESRGFLNRWSARKQAVEKDRQVVAESHPASDKGLLLEPEPVSEAERLASLTSPTGEILTETSGDALLSDVLRQADFPSTASPSQESGSASEQASIDETGTPDESAAGVSITDTDQATKPLLVDADMPPIETLTASSDISGFLSKGVSAALRKAALRHVFRQSSYNVRDGLNDYDGDFTSFEPLGDTVTSDMKFHAARKEKARLEAEIAAQEEEARLEAERQASAEEVPLEAESDESEEEDRLEAESEASTDQERLDSESEAPAETDRPEAEQLAAEQDDAEMTAGHGPTVSADEDSHTRNHDSTAG